MRGSTLHYRCPKASTSAFGQEVVRIAAAVQAGFLPTTGGYGDQPSRLMRLVEIALHERAQIEGTAQAPSAKAPNPNKG
jgi:hypothetical protein